MSEVEAQENDLVLVRSHELEGTRFERGCVLGRLLKGGELEATAVGVTRGNLVALRRRGIVQVGPLEPQPQAETAEEKAARLEAEAEQVKRDAAADAERQERQAAAAREKAQEAFDETELPADFPGLEALKGAEVLTFGRLKAVEDLTSVNGIGDATAKAVAEALAAAEAAAGLAEA